MKAKLIMSIVQMAGLIVLFLVFYGVFLVSCERQIIYHPYKYPEGNWSSVSTTIFKEDVHFMAGDGVKLHGWYVPSTKAKATLLWFHGNAGNITHRLDNIEMLRPLNLNIFIFDYRGYGKSEGAPDEKGIYSDSQAAYDWLVKDKNILPDQIILFGRSLGGICAVEVASKNPAAGIILESAFPSAQRMADKIFPILPLGWAIKSRFDAISKVRNLELPKLFIHGTRDEIVPYEMGRELFSAAAEPKTFYDIPAAGHNDTFLVGGADYFNALGQFVKNVVSSGPDKNS